ncbi:hypothetical protein GCM10010389_18660 [Streptomyces echinoruber]|uniref:Uncharacterized protein n=1 Tax=Streptomyces echinoruber TaxID=68898 RepID=A0A918R442_9ACTN|nr:hypothetical protein GCM10010389_18660 [Streptomyces echinoruber]
MRGRDRHRNTAPLTTASGTSAFLLVRTGLRPSLCNKLTVPARRRGTAPGAPGRRLLPPRRAPYSSPAAAQADLYFGVQMSDTL